MQDAQADAQFYPALLAEADRYLRESATALDGAVGALARAVALDPTPNPTAQALMWTIQRQRGQHRQYFAAAFQDRFLDELVFRGHRSGVFADVGAHDGITGSNTLFFEKFRGWTGVCIEPDLDRFTELQAARAVHCEPACIAAQSGHADFFRVRQGFTQMGGLRASMNDDVADFLASASDTDTITLPTRRLGDVLAAHELFHIDYISIDIEGAEFDVLRSLDFRRFDITALSVERNANEVALRALLRAAGFCRVRQLGADDMFVSAAFIARHAPHLVTDMLAEAIAHYEHGDMPRAEAAYRDILLAEPDNPGLHYNFALTLRAQQKHTEAQSALEAAIVLKPDFAPALELLTK